MAQERCALRHEVKEVSFGVYTEEEIRKLSAVRIVSSISYDRLGNPIKGGLYDPAMGPLDHRSICITCGLSMRDCPGHLGHIVLCVEVYNPLTFPTVYQIMRLKCFECHRLRLGAMACRTVAVKLMLIDSGAVEEAKGLDARLMATETRGSVLADYEARLKNAPIVPWESGDVKAERRTIVKEFLKEVLGCKRCDHCSAIKVALRKDGHTKLFLRTRAQGRGDRGSQPRSALQAVHGEGEAKAADDSEPESDDEDEDEDGGDRMDVDEPPASKASSAKAGDKYMAPSEVASHLQLLWQSQTVLVSLLWGRASSKKAGVVGRGDKEGWRPYFWKLLAIPPSRFRPPGRNDDGSLSEHPQNSNIAKIMGFDERIRTLMQSEMEEAAAAAGGGQAAAGSEQQGERAVLPQLRAEAMARVLSIWIELQNAVNAYIDSSKDANAKGGQAVAIQGIRQGLEKKEGLFRMHMMGKRVNFACRSVISPDPYIGTSEIGLPVRFARVLTYPQPVTPGNVVQLRQLVEIGPSGYPGANFIEDAKGRLIDLSRMNDAKRKALAARLLTPPGQKVWRHLHDGDVVLMNRQPTLHKPGIMAHKARVLRNPKQQTIRMHYANCNTYNADFDGDEMNCHFPQDELSRAEAEVLACTDEQYIVPTNGKPLRGLIQDHVCSGVKLTAKDTFLTRGQFQHILYAALSGLPGVEIVGPKGHIHMPPPTIWKPRKLWTGKQVVSALLHHLTSHLPSLNLDFKAKTPPVAFGADQHENEVVIREGELLRGVLDKAAFGASETGLVHAIYEFYGAHFAGRLLTAFGRLFTVYLQFAGHTCGIEDLVLSREADKKRKHIISKVTSLGQHAMKSFVQTRAYQPPAGSAAIPRAMTAEEVDAVRQSTADLMEEDVRTGDGAQGRAIDGFMQSVLAPLSSELIKACLPDGLRRPFPANTFSLMVSTGAKGSPVNQSQVSCSLGQQALEGRRVPLMPSGKSLPSFPPYDPSPRAGGFIADRFLTGVRPQEYFFHCMAGREGLIDTAVKTSRSGYLQRCLVKGLEELKVCYDHTVRDADGGVVQFMYGDDGVDPVHAKYLDGQAAQMTALARNHAALLSKYGVDAEFFQRTGMALGPATSYHRRVAAARSKGGHAQEEEELEVGSVVEAKRLKHGRTEWVASALKDGWYKAEVVKVHEAKGQRAPSYEVRYEDGSTAKVPVTATVAQQASSAAAAQPARRVPTIRSFMPDPFTSTVHLGCTLGAVSERFQDAIDGYIKANPDALIISGDAAAAGGKKKKKRKEPPQPEGVVSPASFQLLLWLKYMRSLAAPGEAVGSIAGQSIGEPSTQMTLNTFHLAGHGGANVTLGIPRLREILMTASQNIKTPSMTVKLRPGLDKEEATRLAGRLRMLLLAELIHHKKGVSVTERLRKLGPRPWERLYQIRLQLYDEETIKDVFGVDYDELVQVVRGKFLRVLLMMLSKEAKREVLQGWGRAKKGGMGKAGKKGAGRGGGDDDEGAKEVDDEQEMDLDEPRRAKKGKVVDPDDEDDDEDDEEAEDDDDAQGTLKFGRQQEGQEYEEDEGDEEEKDEEGEPVKQLRRPADEEEGADGGEEEEQKGGKRRSSKGGSHEGLPAYVAGHPLFEDVKFDRRSGVVEIAIKTRASSRRLLMVTVVESAADKCTVRTSEGISQAFVVDDSVQTAGCNFAELWEAADPEVLDLSTVKSNDIYQVLQTYGVEAARQTIVTEIKNVFGAYGIVVDPRHLALVADFMTYQGGFRALNRGGMQLASSPFLQMSFETTGAFLTESAFTGDIDNLATPSARLVVGQPTPNGTGCCSMLVPIPGLQQS